MIPDAHDAAAGWGVRPVLFAVAGHPVASYSFFVLLGLVAAVALYYLNTRGRDVGSNGLYVALAAAAGGILGAKLPIWVVHWREVLAHPLEPSVVLSGRTIVGGIIGGVAAVWLVKRRLGIKRRLGNYLVPSLCLGIAFGRVGCFLAGCCYGTPTTLPWGVDFGDGIARHPVQLYEALVVLAMFAYAQVMLGKYRPGDLFWWFMTAYFSWRFLAETIRVNPVWTLGLTYYQVAALVIASGYALRRMAIRMEGARQWT